MQYLYLGKIVNTHGIKGEVRIISDFEYKEDIFKIDNIIYYGNDKEPLKINSYRKHKNYDMITFNNISNINDVLKYKGGNVYLDRSNIGNKYTKEDLIGMKAIYNSNEIGIIKDIEKNGLNELIIINNKMIPYNKHFIKSVDIEKKEVILENIEGLI